MPTVAEAVWQSWQFDPWALILLLMMGAIYVCGWRQVHRQMPHRFGAARLTSFLAGLAALVIAIGSPLDAFAGLLLTAHMLQHLLLLLIVPPLLLSGAPYLPLLRGLPPRVVKHGLGPLLAWPALWGCGRRLTHPLSGWLAFVVTGVAWHVPALYELALQSPGWHEFEHLCFLSTALLFWWPVLQPWPSRPQGSRWVLIPYLFLADVQNTILAAFLTFCERVLYPTYATAPRFTPMTALDDQAAAGAIMWVLGSVAFLIPAGCVTIQMLQTPCGAVRPVSGGSGTSTATAARQRRRPVGPGASWDLRSIPLIGAVVRWPHLPRVAQTAMLLLHATDRAALGRLSRRPDVAALVLVLVCGALVNAAGMVSSVAAWEQAWQDWIGGGALLQVMTGVLILGVLITPALLAAVCGVLSQALGGLRGRWQELTCNFVTALVPLGCSMWLAHLVSHLVTGAHTVVPVAQRAAADLGIGLLGAPHWALASTPVLLDWLPSLQILLLDCGLLLTLYIGWRMALRLTSRAARAVGVLAPWGGLALALYAAGVWMVFQPMPMRGMMHAMMP
jgi:cytochrome c oxidase assembly factor CtaG